MNEKGFGEIDVIAFIFVVFLSIAIVSISYKKLEKNNPSISSSIDARNLILPEDTEKIDEEIEIKASTYQELEDKIALESKAYFEVNSEEGKTQTVLLQTLIQNDYIPTIYALEDSTIDCLGYVDYYKDSNQYKTYLKCGTEYETQGYDTTKEVNNG